MLKYHSLRDKVFSLKNLYAAFHHGKKNKGKAGLDRVSIKQFESDLENNMINIHKELKTEIYQPSPVLRAYIPKDKYNKRPLGITHCQRQGRAAGVQANHRAYFRERLLG